MLGGCGAPLQLQLLKVSRKDKKKKILVVYKLICFHGFVFIAKQSSKAARADGALDCCMLWASLTNMMTKPTNRMEDTDGTCILLYRIEIFYMMQVS